MIVHTATVSTFCESPRAWVLGQASYAEVRFEQLARTQSRRKDVQLSNCIPCKVSEDGIEKRFDNQI
jgi:hypothetical protein